MPSPALSTIVAMEEDVSIQAKFVVYDEISRSLEKKTFSFDLNKSQKDLLAYVSDLLGYISDSFELFNEREQQIAPITEVLNVLELRAGGLNKLYLREGEGTPSKKIHKDDTHKGDLTSTKNSILDAIKSKRKGSDDDDDDTTTSKTTTTTGGSYTSSYDRLSDTGFVGLANQGATCYLNSLLQTLFMTPEFRNAIYEWRPSTSATSIATELQRLFVLLQTSKARSVETTDLTKSFGWDRSEAFQQHDVQELMRVLYDAIEKQWAGTDKASMINDLYQGEWRDFVQCKECGFESARNDKFLDVPLVLRAFGSTTAVSSVEEALGKFVETESLDKENQYHCSKCNKKVDALKGLKIVRLPYLLTLQLKRFDFDINTFQRIKLNDRVSFPLVLDMSPFLSRDTLAAAAAAAAATAASAGPASDPAVAAAPAAESASVSSPVAVEPPRSDSAVSISSAVSARLQLSDPSAAGSAAPSAALAEPASAADAATATANADGTGAEAASASAGAGAGEAVAMEVTGADGNQYELFSIMIHSGSALGGHYYAYIKSLENNKWYCFNDSSVSEITQDAIEKTFGGASSAYSSYYYSAHSMSAYMLMYRRIDKARNKPWYTAETMPEHSRNLLAAIAAEEERRREEDERKAKLTTITIIDAEEKSVELQVPKLITITDLTELAHKELDLEKRGFPLDRMRLRRFRYGRVPGDTFEGKEGKTLTELSLIWGVTNLMMEASRPDGTFEEYDPNGIMPDLYVCDLSTKTLTKLPIVIGDSRTIGELKDIVLQKLGLTLPRARMLVFKAPYTGRDVIAVRDEASSLYDASIYSQTKVGVCVVEEDADVAAAEDQIRATLLQALNSVTIKLVRYEHPNEDGQTIKADQRQIFREFKKQVLAPLVGLDVSEFKVYKPPYYTDAKPIEISMPEEILSYCLSGSDNKLLYQKGRAAGEGEIILEAYFCDFYTKPDQPILERFGEMPFTSKCISSNAKAEFIAHVNRLKEADPAKFAHLNLDLDPRRLRMRDINAYGDGPTCGYFGEESPLLLHLVRRMCFEVLKTPDPEVMENHSPLFLRRWHPDTNTWGLLEEILVPHAKYSVDGFYEALVALAGIPREHLSIARGPSFYPFEKTVLEAENVAWQGELTRITDIAYGQIDGTCLLYKDRRTVPTPLSADERARLSKEVAAKKKATRTSYFGKERALKINVGGEKKDDDKGAAAAAAAAGAAGAGEAVLSIAGSTQATVGTSTDQPASSAKADGGDGKAGIA